MPNSRFKQNYKKMQVPEFVFIYLFIYLYIH